jgi:hypothetical protein
MRELELTQDEQTYLKPILERRTRIAKADSPKTLDEYLARWKALIIKIEGGNPPDLALFANEVTCREIVELDIKPAAPESLAAKIDEVLREWDDRYVAATGELDKAWFGDGGDPKLWWWYRCPKSWYQYDRDRKSDG